MHTPENSSQLYPISENSSHRLQVDPIKTRPYPAENTVHQRTSRSGKKRRTRYFRLKCALSASLIILTGAAGSTLYLLNTSATPLEKISSPAFFSDLDSGNQPSAAADGLRQDQDASASEIQKGTVHITSFSEDWNLILVNPWNSIPKDYHVSLMPIQTGHYVDARCYPELQKMLDDCTAAGLSPIICSSYRTQETQQELFDERVDELTAQGYNIEDAYDKAATSVALPGTSEHQLGLAVDIVDRNHQLLDTSQETTPVQQWLMENCWKYGFILRYPNGTSDLTGIIYEPWHYRYVGKKTAKKIHKRGICLEEYLAGL